MWLSDHDFLNGTLAAITAKDVKFATVNLMSNDPGMRWNIEESARDIDYQPQDGSKATMTIKLGIQASLKKLFTFSIPRAFERWFPEW